MGDPIEIIALAVGRIETKVDGIQKRLDEVEDHLARHDLRFDAVDERLERIERKLNRHEGRIEALEEPTQPK